MRWGTGQAHLWMSERMLGGSSPPTPLDRKRGSEQPSSGHRLHSRTCPEQDAGAVRKEKIVGHLHREAGPECEEPVDVVSTGFPRCWPDDPPTVDPSSAAYAAIRCILANRQGRTRNVLTRRCPQMDNYRHARHSKDGLLRWDRVQSRRDPYPPRSPRRPSRASRSPVRHLLVHKRGHLLGRHRCRAPTRCVLSA